MIPYQATTQYSPVPNPMPQPAPPAGWPPIDPATGYGNYTIPYNAPTTDLNVSLVQTPQAIPVNPNLTDPPQNLVPLPGTPLEYYPFPLVDRGDVLGLDGLIVKVQDDKGNWRTVGLHRRWYYAPVGTPRAIITSNYILRKSTEPPITGGDVVPWPPVTDGMTEFWGLSLAVVAPDGHTQYYDMGLAYGGTPAPGSVVVPELKDAPYALYRVSAMPQQPLQLVATIVSPTQCNLAWVDNSTNESGFTIIRATDSAFTANVVNFSVAANVTNYSDTTCVQLTLYYYKVVAFNSSGSSPSSNVVLVNTPGSMPIAPSNLAATVISPIQCSLTWTDNSQDETGFVITRASDSAFTANVVNRLIAANVTSYLDTCSESSTYYYKVSSVNSAGASPASNVVTITTPASLPIAPSNFAIGSTSSTSCTLTWVDNSFNEVGFNITRATDPLFTLNVATFLVSTNINTYTDSTCKESTTYYYRICAFNSAGSSVFANMVTAITPASLPLAPTNLIANIINNQSVLSWVVNSTNETSIIVQRDTSSAFAAPYETSLAAKTTTYTDTSITAMPPGTVLYYRVLARNGAGNSTYSNVASVSVPVPVGINGAYYQNLTLYGYPAVKRIDSNISFDWSTVPPVSGWALTNYSVRWTGRLIAKATEQLTLYTYSDDGVRLWFNGNLIINNWTNHGGTENSFVVSVVAGQKYDLQVEYFQGSGGAAVKLSWSSPTITKAVIPSSSLIPDVITTQPLQLNALSYIMDNTTSGVAKTGTWLSSTSTKGYYGSDYLTDGNTNKGKSNVNYPFTVPEIATYEIFGNWAALKNRASNVPIDIYGYLGKSTIIVNQRSGGNWSSLGKYICGTKPSVVVRNDATNGYVIADAFKLVTNYQNGLLGMYYANGTLLKAQLDGQIAFTNFAPTFNGVAANAVTWIGKFKPPTTDVYSFSVAGNQTTLTVNNVASPSPMKLYANTYYAIQITCIPNGSTVQFNVSTSSYSGTVPLVQTFI